MKQNLAQYRTGRSSGRRVPAYRASSRRPLPRRRRALRRRAAIMAARRRRRPMLFYAVVASVTGELAAIVVDMEALVLLFSLTALLLCAVVFQVAKI
jgi:hypothetical protein